MAEGGVAPRRLRRARWRGRPTDGARSLARRRLRRARWRGRRSRGRAHPARAAVMPRELARPAPQAVRSVRRARARARLRALVAEGGVARPRASTWRGYHIRGEMGEMGAVQGRVGEAGAVGGGLEACAERGCEPLWAKGGAARTGGYMGEATTLGTRGARAAFYGTGWAPSEAERSCASRGSMFQTQQLSRGRAELRCRKSGQKR